MNCKRLKCPGGLTGPSGQPCNCRDCCISRKVRNEMAMLGAQDDWAGCCCTGNCPDLSTQHCAGCPREHIPKPPSPEQHCVGYHLLKSVLYFGGLRCSDNIRLGLCDVGRCAVLREGHTEGEGRIWIKQGGEFQILEPRITGPHWVLVSMLNRPMGLLRASTWRKEANLGAFCWGLRHIMLEEMLLIQGGRIQRWPPGSKKWTYLFKA